MGKFSLFAFSLKKEVLVMILKKANQVINDIKVKIISLNYNSLLRIPVV
jgi:hypothetical protein